MARVKQSREQEGMDSEGREMEEEIKKATKGGREGRETTAKVK